MRHERASLLGIWTQHFWMLLENMLCEASATLPERMDLRIISAVWWIAIVVLTNGFTGQMRACLMVKSELKRINTLADIAERPNLKVYTVKDSVVTNHLKASQGAAEQKVWSMMRRDKSDIHGLIRLPDEMIHEIVQEKAVVIHIRTFIDNGIANFCAQGGTGEFNVGAEVMYTLILGPYMSRQMNETLRKRIKKLATAFVESGIVSHLYDTAIPSLDRCSVAGEREELKLQDLASVFYLYAIFCFSSILIFVGEVIDITMPTVARAADRDILADAAPPVTIVPVNILGGRNRTRETNMAGYLLTFDPQVWAMLLFSLLFLSIVLVFLDAILQKMRKKDVSVFGMWNQYFWMLFENMFCEASAEMPDSTHLRIISAIWWLAIVVLMNAFAGQMRACLMFKSELKRINTLADIAERPDLKVYTLKNTVATRYLQSSQGPAEKTVWSMIRRDKSDIYGLLSFSEDMIHEIVQEKAAGKFCAQGEPGEFYVGTEVMYTLIFGPYMNRGMNETVRRRIKRM
ncbi:hypothetical protein MTO96_049446 [Rhipicephalus appendiculatus]